MEAKEESNKKLLYFSAISMILFLLASVSYEMLYFAIFIFSIFLIILNISDGLIYLIFLSCFYKLFDSSLIFSLFYLIFILILTSKAIILHKPSISKKFFRIFKLIFILINLTLFIFILISTIIQKKLFVSEILILDFIFSVQFIAYSYNKINLKKLAKYLAIGIISSSLLAFVLFIVQILPKSAILVEYSSEIKFNGLFINADVLALYSIFALMSIAIISLKRRASIGEIISIVLLSFIGLETYSLLFILAYLLLVILASMIFIFRVRKTKNKKGAWLAWGLVIACFVLSIPWFVDFVKFIRTNFRDDALASIFTSNNFNNLWTGVKSFFNLSWQKVIFGTAFSKNHLILKSNLILTTLYTFGLVGVLCLTLSIIFLFASLRTKRKNILIYFFLTFLAMMCLISVNLPLISLGALFISLSLNTSLDFDAKISERYVKGENSNILYLWTKRMLDIVISLIAIVLLAIPMLIVGLAVKFTSAGPIILTDERVGKDGEKFVVYKFRSMFKDSQARLEMYLSKEQLEAFKRERKVDNDPRVTKVGRFIRKTSLDELPQLFNILLGDMSIVGNRPITELELDTYFSDDEKKILYQQKPGLTGLWQVDGRSNVTWTSGKRQELYLYYAKNASLILDIKIFFKTFIVVLFRKGAK